MTSLSKYLGIHAPMIAGYTTGQMEAWAKAFGATPDDTRGVAALFKRIDTPEYWKIGQAAPLTASNELFISECGYWMYQIYSQWMPFDTATPLIQDNWTSDYNASLMTAAADVAVKYPGRLMFANKANSNFVGTDAFYADLVGQIGRVWSNAGREWGYVDDEGGTAVLQHLPGLQSAWESYGCRPDVVAYHAYGLSDWGPQHAKLMAAGVRSLLRHNPIIMHQEAHWFFLGFGNPRSSKPYLYETGAGEYCADMCEANSDAGIETCLFTVDQFFELAGASLTDSGKALVSRASGTSMGPGLDVPFRAGRLKSYALRNKYMSRGAATMLTLALG